MIDRPGRRIEMAASLGRAASACLFVIHNDERNTGENANRLRRLYRSKMPLREPDNKSRHIVLPAHGTREFDPNNPFPGGSRWKE